MERAEPNTTRATKPAGRKGADKTPAVQDATKLKEDMPRLKKLKIAADEAREDYQAAVVKTAEKSGFLSSVVSKAVNAYAGDDFEEKHRQVTQLALAFDEVAKV